MKPQDKKTPSLLKAFAICAAIPQILYIPFKIADTLFGGSLVTQETIITGLTYSAVSAIAGFTMALADPWIQKLFNVKDKRRVTTCNMIDYSRNFVVGGIAGSELSGFLNRYDVIESGETALAVWIGLVVAGALITGTFKGRHNKLALAICLAAGMVCGNSHFDKDVLTEKWNRFYNPPKTQPWTPPFPSAN